MDWGVFLWAIQNMQGEDPGGVVAKQLNSCK